MKKKRVSVIGIILLIIVIIAAGGFWYWNTYKKRIIRSELEKAITEKSGGLYKVHYGNLELDEVNGHLSVSSFTLTYDSIKYLQLKKEQRAPHLLFTISIPEIQITGVETPRALIDKEISGRHLAIINPVIEIIYTNAGKDSSRHLPDKEIYEQILGNLNLIKLDSVTISGAEITTKNLADGKTLVHFLNTSVSLIKVKVDSAGGADTTRLLFAKEINLDCEKFTWHSQDMLYNYQVDSLALRSAISTVSIKNFFILPQLKENDFVKKFSHQIDRFDFAIHNIQLKNTDLNQLSDEMIQADTLVIGSASFKIYRDRNFPEDKKSKVGAYPQQLIQKIPFQIEIKKAIVKNANIVYKEKSSVTHQSGKVQFGNLSAYISNITNRKESIADNNQMVVDMQGYLLNKIPLSSKWIFYLGNPDGKFNLSGKGGGTDAAIFNVLTIPMGPAQFKTGHINSLEFNLAGTNHQMDGNVKLLYDDIHVSMLKKEEDSVHFKKRRMMSLFANMKIKNFNPEKDKSPRIAGVHYRRDIHKSIFNLVWKSIFEGIQEIGGIK